MEEAHSRRRYQHGNAVGKWAVILGRLNQGRVHCGVVSRLAESQGEVFVAVKRMSFGGV